MRRKPARYVPAVFILILAACISPASPPAETLPAPTPVAERFIVFGDISDDPAEVIEGTQPLADVLAAGLAEYGVSGAKVKVVNSPQEIIQLLKSGEIDLYFDSVYPATLVSDASGAKIILRRWRFGVETYQSVIFASRESGVKSVEDLKGRMVAMDTPYSTSGFLLPAVYLVEKGMKLSGKADSGEAVAPDEIGFTFAYDDENILQWVLSGVVPAGVTDDYHFDKAFPREAVQNLVELGRTESTPRQVALVRPDMDPALQDAIVEILTTMHETPQGQAALEKFQTTRFDVFPEGIEAATQRMREMMEIVKEIPLP
ncbi:MAG: phosphate/phosphite/phosphonate ABC transporter substrate-binding protein [Chloroflexi bacterium]|nr:phosphate/phosphite/phosphonate ABC transporter substrate-binding protein [Chloroflexota bacterium]MCA2003112.1 phosphate/phosphite/phosphonate ABC transporter substrate-binding protein [Chloroflexota bacterium]